MIKRTSSTNVAAKALAALAAMCLALAACSGAADSDAEAADEEALGETDLPAIPIVGPERRILAFGDSLFAGYGFDDPDTDSYPAKLEAALRAKGINAAVTNAGVSGDTSAAGRQRLEFVLDAMDEAPDLFILELGGNDLLRGLSPEETRTNIAAMLDVLGDRSIPVLIMGMRAPPNYGPEYQADFDAIYGDIAQQYETPLIPFWLESVYDKPALFQDDRIHPTIEGIEVLVGATVDQVAQALPETNDAAEEAAEAS